MEQLIIDCFVVILQYNKINGQWNELGSVSGQCRLALYKSSKNEYRFVAWKKVDNEVVLNTFLFSTMHYASTSPTFYQWIDVRLSIFGFKFNNSNEAKNFSVEVLRALESLNLENRSSIFNNVNIATKSMENKFNIHQVDSGTEIDVYFENQTKLSTNGLSNCESLQNNCQIVLKPIKTLPTPLNFELYSSSKTTEISSHQTFDILSEIVSKSRIRSSKSFNQQTESSKADSSLSSLIFRKCYTNQSQNLAFTKIDSSSEKREICYSDLEKLRISLMKDFTSYLETIKNEIISCLLAKLECK